MQVIGVYVPLIQLGPGDAICHLHWLWLAQVDGSGIRFSMELVRAAWAQQNDLLDDWRDDMEWWIRSQRPLCESLPVAEVERAWRKALKPPFEVKGKKKLATVPTTPIWVDSWKE